MKAFTRTLSIISGFILILSVHSHAYAFDTIENMHVDPLVDRTVVISWTTTKASSSKVRFTTQLYGESESPDYATHTTGHQVKIDGIIPGLSYRFYAESTDENGDTSISAPFLFMLPAVDVAAAAQFPSVQDEDSLATESVDLVDLLQEARTYTQSQIASTGFAFVTFLLTLAIFLAEETTWFLFFDWILGFAALHLWHSRRQKSSFRVLDSRTNRPIPGAEVALLIGGQIVQTFHSTELGDVLFSWPTDKPITVRISRKGFHALERTFAHGLDDVALDPLFAPMGKELIPAGLIFGLKHSLKIMHSSVLILGTLLLIPSLLAEPSLLDGLTTGAYLLLWVLYFFSLPRRFHMVQVIDVTTHQPLSFARIASHGPKGSRHYITDRNGLARFLYPLPSSVTIHKKGYQPVINQALSATSIAPGILILGMQSVTQPLKENNVPLV